MKYLKITTSIIAVLSLSACLGSGDKKVVEAPVEEPVVEEPVVEVAATYVEKANTINALLNTINTGTGLDVDDDDYLATNNFDLPNTGSANYTGVMDLDMAYIDSPAGTTLLGDFDMDVDFASLEVSGDADNFSNSLNEVWAGNLVVEGDFDGSINIEIDGTLTDPSGLNTIVAMDVTDMTIYGSDAAGAQTPEYVEGDMVGDATVGGVTEDITGGFIGQLTP